MRTIDPFSSARAMLAALRERSISAVELLHEHRSRFQSLNPDLNALVQPDFERNAEAAIAADERRARGEDAPLLGLCLTVKESLNVEGLHTTVGMAQWQAFRSRHDAPIVTRIKAAGGAIMAKTNVSPMLADWQAANPVYGRTANPWDLSRTSGGSSGGAAAVAAGLTPLDFGSDIAGSIRVPAAFCGVYGHKPSETAVPRSGQYPIAPMPNSVGVMAAQGPIARSAEDLELALDVVAGADAGEDVAWRLSLPPARRERLKDFRVALMPWQSWIAVDSGIATAAENVCAQLGRLGAVVKTAQPEILGDHRRHYELFLSMLAAVTSARLTDDERRQRLEVLKSRDDQWAAAQRQALEGPASRYIAWNGQREQIRAAWRAFFRDWDVVIAPAWLAPAFPHREQPWPATPESLRGTIEVNGKSVLYELGNFYPSVATFPGQPATVFPAGINHAGLPIGLQAIGPYLEDRTTISFAALLAREYGGFRPPPAFQTARGY